MAVQFAAYVFDGSRSASRALDDAIEADAAGAIWLEDVAVIRRNKLGRVSVHSTWAQDDDNVGGGIGWGALTGSLLGALAGPGGALAGLAVGGGFGAVFGAAMDISVSDPRLDEFAASLKRDTSALVLVGETRPFVDLFVEAEAKLIETAIAAETIEEIKKASTKKKRSPAHA